MLNGGIMKNIFVIIIVLFSVFAFSSTERLSPLPFVIKEIHAETDTIYYPKLDTAYTIDMSEEPNILKIKREMSFFQDDIFTLQCEGWARDIQLKKLKEKQKITNTICVTGVIITTIMFTIVLID